MEGKIKSCVYDVRGYVEVGQKRRCKIELGYVKTGTVSID